MQLHYRAPTAPTYVVSGAGGNRESNADPGGKKEWSAYPMSPVCRNRSMEPLAAKAACEDRCGRL